MMLTTIGHYARKKGNFYLRVWSVWEIYEAIDWRKLANMSWLEFKQKRAGEHCRDQEILLIGNADGAIRNALYHSPHRFSAIHPTVCNPIHHSVRSIVIRIGSDIDLQFLFINKLRIGCDAETSVGSSETERVFKKNATMLVRFQYPRHGITGCESNLVLHGRIGLLKIEIGW